MATAGSANTTETATAPAQTEYQKWVECLELYSGPCPVEVAEESKNQGEPAAEQEQQTPQYLRDQMDSCNVPNC